MTKTTPTSGPRTFNFRSREDVAAWVAQHGAAELEAVGTNEGFALNADFDWYHAWVQSEAAKARVVREKLAEEREARTLSAAEDSASAAKWSALAAVLALLVSLAALWISAAPK